MGKQSLSVSSKGQTSVLNVIFSLIGFFILWALWLGEWLSNAGTDLVINNNLTGIEAFLASNLNLWVFFGLILGVIWLTSR